MTTLSTSDFAKVIFGIFPSNVARECETKVFNYEGCCAVYAKETEKGNSVVRINGKSFGKMTKDEKLAAVEYVNNLHVEVIKKKLCYNSDSVCEHYYVAGEYEKYVESCDDWQKEILNRNFISKETYR